ncbi:hypothetical protein CDD80_3692 [Ophiocordyceps camponoti-rufipedis]|uniref:Uncharacterized protein n=1 Tax=Ophiocordyceps camponoti-rufipedis TaxID=2004952 RepID=A0A2C5ZKN9_9HYPO|nr:hypothetical protein CDD80_3692 [Ophiocordyceps camponoti-rufipedis]
MILFRRLLSTATLSFARGPSQPSLLTNTIPSHLSTIVNRHGTRPAVISRTPSRHGPPRETTLTYSALDALSSHLARQLLRIANIKAGDRIVVSLGNGHEFAALTYAVYKLGAVLVPLNPTLGPEQVKAALTFLSARVVVLGAAVDLAYRPGRGRSNARLVDSIVGGKRPEGLERVVLLDNREQHQADVFDDDVDAGLFDCLDGRGDGFVVPYSELLDSKSSLLTTSTSASASSSVSTSPSLSPSPPADFPPLSPSSITNIQFTSGTTSTPKAAQLSHRSILNNGNLIAHRMGLVPSDAIVVPPPLFHCFGSVLGYMATATTGAAILFPSPAFDPVAALRMAIDHDATGLYGVPTMFIAMLEALDKMDEKPARLTKGIASGSSVPESLMRRIHDRLGLSDLVICYGQTETGPVSCMTTPGDPPDKLLSSVGRPLPHTAVKIVSPADRSVIVPIGEKGELVASGYHLMEGYYDDADRTAEVRVREPNVDGSGDSIWMYSGDQAVMSADGYVSITGRIKDLIIRGGENINPLEIEECLAQLPAIRDVSVVGVPCPRLGEAVAAFVRPADDNLTADAVRDWVRDRLSSHLVPKHVLFWSDEFPKTASGKVQKFKLRDEAVAKLQNSEQS